jgi:hypothetical protein
MWQITTNAAVLPNQNKVSCSKGGSQKETVFRAMSAVCTVAAELTGPEAFKRKARIESLVRQYCIMFPLLPPIP